MRNRKIIKRLACALACVMLFSSVTAYANAPEPSTVVTKETGTENTVSDTQAAEDQTSPMPETDIQDPEPVTPVFAAPTLESVKRIQYNRLKLTWSRVPGAKGYYIYRKAEGATKYKKIATVKKGKTVTYTDKTFVCNKKYTYTVKAYKKVDGKTVTTKRSNAISKTSKYTGMQKVNNRLYYFNKNYECYRMVDGDKKMICLTYDDGPSAYTDTILKTLKQYDSVATFFVIGNRVNSYKSTVKKMDKYHCQVANHTYTHPNLTRLSSSSVKSEISKTDSAVKKIIGKKPTALRPPGGNYNSTVKSVAGKPLIYWSIDTRDWATRSSSQTISAVLNNAKDGDIVLMHDLYESTAIASKTIIPTLVSRGYQLVTIDEMAALRGGAKNGSVYVSFRK